MSDQAYELRWGILGAGYISGAFVKDLLVDPASRNVTDVVHRVVGVGSRSLPKAQNFIDNIPGLPKEHVIAYGSYKDLLDDPNVDVVYIGTPHSSHYDHVQLCLCRGKHVLCEKPMTVNAQQAKDLVKLAREKQCFIMEALWTRFMPITYNLQETIASGQIGEIQRVHADLSLNFNPDSLASEHRLVNPKLAGGVLLDLGPYAWTMVALTLLHNQSQSHSSSFLNDMENASKPRLPFPKVKASGVLYKHPQASPMSRPVDGTVIAALEFPNPSGQTTQGLLITSLFQNTNLERAVTIYGTKGRIRIPHPIYCPSEYGVTVFNHSSDRTESAVNRDNPPKETVYKFNLPGNARGYIWEADEVARCIKSRAVESTRMPHAETILMMEVFDEIRQQIGVKFPEQVESFKSL
ncbi:hypothetical protein O181_082921 [Austropuccinia psidii MF-1]|uniref:D-xylose 1-dehydrogenase (NADP(+), D-xylono-1,5-lactone-forming) n=1 Tax=Austropuccinia psidii MF-1 TaxID=1389203 RepID=A0A9Q3IHF5_9BASI|nr:hypothetical protein [Austropuccinia psidii MF-1]